MSGPSQATNEMLEAARTGGRRFRLVDEGDLDELAVLDGKKVDPVERSVVFDGLTWTRDEPGIGTDFAPLSDYGEPAHGCVGTQYLVNDVWGDL